LGVKHCLLNRLVPIDRHWSLLIDFLDRLIRPIFLSVQNRTVRPQTPI